MVDTQTPTERFDLDGRVAIITGAARSIGRTTAETLAAHGATVISFDLSPSDEMVAAVVEAGGRAAGYVLDVTNEDEVNRAVADVVTRNGGVNILVNNAGLFTGIQRRPFWEIDLAEWERVMGINTTSVFLCSRAVVDPMRRAGSGRIVNIASNVVTFGMPNLMHYVASKGAVAVMTRSMARELGSFGITVNAVGPGLVTTEQTTAENAPEYRQMVVEGQCIKEEILPGDIADAVLFLVSPAARMVSGQSLLVNGGASMGGV